MYIYEEYQSSRTGDMQTRLLLTYFVSHDLEAFDRSVYTFWGALGDVGGLYQVVATVMASVAACLNFHKPVNNIAEKLYKPAHDPDSSLNAKNQSMCKEFLQSCLPKRCRNLKCIRQSKKDLYFKRAREQFSDELDVVTILRQLRFLTAAV